jgi:hypothetical protein
MDSLGDVVLGPRPSVSDACALKPQCCSKTPSRKITRDVRKDARDRARALMGTPELDKPRDERIGTAL